MRSFLGIDPGVSGGIVVITEGESPYYPATMGTYKMPDTLKDLLGQLRHCESVEFALLEKVNPMPGEGVKSVATFARNVGHLEMALTASGISWDYVMPNKWQAEFGLLRKDKTETRTKKKNRHKAVAQRLWPSINWTHAIADAALIAEYGRRLRTKT